MDWIIIVAAGFLGGMLNAVAGGGSFITLPALISVGVPPIAANATGTAALLPGYVSSAWRFRHDMEFPANLGFTAVALTALLGGCWGAVILLLTSEQLFSALVPWLILLATAMFAGGPQLLSATGHISASPSATAYAHGFASNKRKVIAVFSLFLVCVYGGYFNGGLGVILLAILGLMGQTNLLGMNGVKNFISAVLTTIAVAVYTVGDVIAGKYLLLLGIAAIVGGYTGASWAYRVPQQALRLVIVAVGLFMSLGFFLNSSKS